MCFSRLFNYGLANSILNPRYGETNLFILIFVFYYENFYSMKIDAPNGLLRH